MGRIELVDDHAWIVSALNDPEILERIKEYGQNIKFDYATVKTMADSGYLLGWYVDEKLTGFYWVHPFNYSALQIHVVFPKQKRIYAKHSGNEMLKWLRNNTPARYKRFIAMIPECYQDVIGFSLREGLKHAGRIGRSSFRGGECYDQIVLGIDREEI